MSSKLTLFPDKSAVFAPQYFGTVGYYALSSAYGKVFIDEGMKAGKRFKSAHRCRIVDTRDEILLTVPVSHPHGHHTWSETVISTHGSWWNNHLTALESAYGRTPFFEFYIDRFASVFDGRKYEKDSITVAETDRLCDKIIRSIIDPGKEVIYTDAVAGTDYDYRHTSDSPITDVPYYQIRADRLGFRAGLSILDLIFNMGPESPLVLAEMMRQPIG